MSRLEEIRNQAKASLGDRQEEAKSEGIKPEEIKSEGPKPGGMVLEMPRRKAPYQAFGAPTSDPQIRLVIYAKQMYLMPRYDILYDVIFSGLYDFVGLIYMHQRVRLYGRNLSGLVAGLQRNSVEWLREYIEPFYELPEADEPIPVITGIEIDGAAFNPFDPTGQAASKS